MTGRLDMLGTALAYASIGWPVFPCRPGGKPPAIPRCGNAVDEAGNKLTGDDLARHAETCPGHGHGCHDATTDEATIRQWWAEDARRNIGVATGAKSGIVAVDVDDPQSFAAFQQQHGDLPATLTAETPRGGWHLIYKRPVDGLRNSGSKLAPGIDVRGDGGYICAAPSANTEAGGVYQWVHTQAPADLPTLVLELLRAPRHEQPAPAQPAVMDDLGSPWGKKVVEGEIGRVLATGPGTKNRNTTLFEAACKVFEAVKGGQVAEVPAWERLRRAGSVVGLNGGEVEGTLGSAWARTAPRQPETKTPHPTSPTASALTSPPAAAPSGERRPRLMSVTDLREMPPARWLIPNRLPEGFTVLFGAPESGKSFMALDWLLTLASQGRPVVYCAGEGATGLTARIDAWMQEHPTLNPQPHLHLLALGSFPYLLQPESVEAFFYDLESMHIPPAVVAVDTWARALVGGDENKYQDVQRGIKVLDDVRERYGSSVLLVAHSGAMPPGVKVAKRPRGHTSMDGAADLMWRMDAPDPTDTSQFKKWRLVCTKAKDFERPRDVEIRLVKARESLVPSPSTPQQIGWV